MTTTTSQNPIVQKILSGQAPQAAQMMAARGLLPLTSNDLLEVLVALSWSATAEVKQAAAETLTTQDEASLQAVAEDASAAASVLDYLAARTDVSDKVQEAVALNANTSDAAIARLAQNARTGSTLEVISINQQRLIRAPEIIDAVLNNPARTTEAERRVTEIRKEFFEKELGARRIAEELKAKGNRAAAEFFETVEGLDLNDDGAVEDAWLIAAHIEVADDEIDEAWLPSERLEEIFAETDEQRFANAERILAEASVEVGELAPERVSLIRRVMLMNVKSRMKLGMKGDREARAILIRDSNKIVATAVINNPRITEQEVESIAAMRTVSDEVLRLISLNRAWSRSYAVTHNLARNPRTPIPIAMGLLNRLRAKDLEVMSKSKNVSETVRRQAYRLAQMRAGK